MHIIRGGLILAWFAAAALVGGCRKAPDDRPVVYCSVDETFGRAILDRYAGQSGIRPRVLFDSEAGKTTGLFQRIVAEGDDPQADVFWSSELFNTIVLARKGLLEPYASPEADDIPPRYRDAGHCWTAFGLRARVLAYDPQRTSREQVPGFWHELADPPVAARLAYANPLFGTTRGHVAALFALWGRDKAGAYLRNLRANGARMVDGNSTAVRYLLEGRAAFAATDTDDVVVANRGGAELEMVYPDIGDGGTLLIPNSVAILAGAPHPEQARRLVDFLLSAEVEEMLARSDSRNFPVRPALRKRLEMELPPETSLSYDAVVDAMPGAVEAVREILVR
jgi:iron(III) transport system substrate-binding protein